ncbi:MAG TPA: phage tail tape measure protein [bacterium]|nr:phage tail tape measure protein [bacterium]
MAVVRELVTKLDFKANLRPLNKTLDRVKRLKAAFGKFILGPVGVVGAALTGAATAMFAFVKVTADGLDKTAKLAKSLSITSSFLQELGFAADLSGVSQDQLGTAILKLSRSMKEAGDDVTTYTDIFDDDLKVAVKDANGELKTVEELLPEIADAFKNTVPETKKTAIALELFGRAGAAMLPLLNEGSKGIEKMRKEARDLGIVFGKDALVQAESFKDEMLRFQSTLKAIGTTIGVAFLPDMRALIETFRKFIVENRKLIKQRIIDFLSKLAFAAGFLFGVFLVFGKVIGVVVEKISSMVDGLVEALEFFGVLKKDAKSVGDEISRLETQIASLEKSIAKGIGGTAGKKAEIRLRFLRRELEKLTKVGKALRVEELLPERLPLTARLRAQQAAIVQPGGIRGKTGRLAEAGRRGEFQTARLERREAVVTQIINLSFTGIPLNEAARITIKEIEKQAKNVVKVKVDASK